MSSKVHLFIANVSFWILKEGKTHLLLDVESIDEGQVMPFLARNLIILFLSVSGQGMLSYLNILWQISDDNLLH